METDGTGRPAYSAGMTLPTLPPLQTGPQVWLGPAMAASGDWIEALSAADIAEIEAAAAPLAERGGDIAALSAADFPLPTLAPRLAAIRHELLDGRGFVLLRGLPVERWPLRLSATAFYGLGLHLGQAISQNAAGHVLGHVRDLGLRSDDPNVRIYQTAERQTFHTDSCDIVGLLCLQTAKQGGDSALVSTGAVWNAVLQQRPDLAAELLQPVATDRRGEVPPGQQPFFMIPVLNWYDGRLSGIYHRAYVDSAQRFADAPRLRPAQVEALDLFDRLCNSAEFHFLMTLQRGDIQLVHNHVLLHDRTAFTDWPEPDRRSHLLRLWLAPADARPLPPVFAQRYGSVTPGARGGVPPKNGRLVAPLDAAGGTVG
jgi:alpha-ketoglutarate-dependent taurine dioxygenase